MMTRCQPIYVCGHQTDEVGSAFSVDISGDQFRYVNSFPISAKQVVLSGSCGLLANRLFTGIAH